MIRKLMLAFSAILLTAALGLAISQQKPEQQPEQKAEQETGHSDKDKKVKVRTGEVVTIDAAKNEITIKDDAGTEARLQVGTFTRITKAGQSITLADLKVGDKISSECAESSDGCKAQSIQVIPPPPSQ